MGHHEIQKIAEKPLSIKQLKTIELLMDIENPRTKKQVANEVGVSERTLYNWFKDPRFLEALNRYADEFIRRSKFLINRQLLKLASEGDIQAIRLYYDLIGNLRDLGTLTITVDLGGLDLDD